MFVKPKKGLTVANPETGFSPIPEEGIEVPDDHPYWGRRVKVGDVEVVEKIEEKKEVVDESSKKHSHKHSKKVSNEESKGE